ncbi:MAG: TraR/DksA C4-type zinc finger protein [Chthoniobacterales bacterium]|nr:TraR/DksA C4-type zinc finger protein [Chthoniobacterales bacterium]
MPAKNVPPKVSDKEKAKKTREVQKQSQLADKEKTEAAKQRKVKLKDKELKNKTLKSKKETVKQTLPIANPKALKKEDGTRKERVKASEQKKVGTKSEQEFVITEHTEPEQIFEQSKKFIPPLKKPIGSVSSKVVTVEEKPLPPSKWAAFLKKQKQRLLDLKDELLDSMDGVAKDALRKRAEDSEANAFGMHQADAGSDAYDRDYALNILSREQNSLYEIEEALKRIEDGTYGICQISGKRIPIARLEALPFTRFTVECQAELERHNILPSNFQSAAFLALGEEEGGEEEEETNSETKE